MVAISKSPRLRLLYPLLLLLTIIPPIILLNRQFLRANRQMDQVIDGYEAVANLWNANHRLLFGSGELSIHDAAGIADLMEKIRMWLATEEIDRLSRFTPLEEPGSRLRYDIEKLIEEIGGMPGSLDQVLISRIDSDFLVVRDILWGYRRQLDGGFSFLVQAQVFLILLLMILVAVATEERSLQQVKLENGRRLQIEISRVQEGERNRIAIDLHDDIAQELSWIRMKLSALTPEPAILSVMDNLVSRIRDMSQSLIAPDFTYENFDNAMRDIILITERRSDLSILYMPGVLSPKEYPELYGHIYRILQECLNNSRKYAGRCRVFIEIQEEGDQIFCDYRDDGTGFKMSDRLWTDGLGFRGIRNRTALINGNFAIEGHPGGGMKLRIQAPMTRYSHEK